MIKKVLILFLFLSISYHAQDGQNVGWISKFGLAGGFNPIFVLPNVDPINQMLPNFGVDELSTSGMMAYGGSGYIYILLIDNVRLGGMGLGLTQTRDGIVNGINRQVDYSMGFGGFTVEYTLPFIKTPAVSIGAIIGAGSLEIDIYQNKNSGNWDDAWNNFEGDADTKMLSMHNSFFTFTPTLNIDYPVTRYLAFRIGAGYILTFAGDWKLNNDLEFSGVPSDLKADSFFIQTGIYLGFFAF